MSTKHWIIIALIVAPLAAASGAYIGLLTDGTLAPPDFKAIAAQFEFGATTATQIIFVLAVAVIVLMAACAPIIYAARSGDLVTILISLLMTGVAIVLTLKSHSVFDQITALIIYLANMVLAAIVYAAHRIAGSQR